MEYSFVYGISPLYNLLKLFRLYALGEPNALKLEKEGLGYVVGSIGRLFGNDNGYGYPPRQPYYTNNPWGCGCNLGPGLHRVNDYIIQVGPTPGQQYGSNFGYC